MRTVKEQFGGLLRSGTAELPPPGSGHTLDRWRALAAVAQRDLALVKLFEGHTDALAIMAELGFDPDQLTGRHASSWGTWAAEPPSAQVRVCVEDATVTVHGVKAWCSGAGIVSHGLLTGWDEHGRQQLVAVPLDQPAVQVQAGAWHAVGMGRVPTPDLALNGARGALVGGPGQYTGRPGFWQGGCGIAACWYGGTAALAARLRHSVRQRPDPYAAAHLGSVDVALRSLRALLVEAAEWIDAHPSEDAKAVALRVRAAADDIASLVLRTVGRALGAAPLCREADVAQLLADLPVFIRQTHAERDLAELGEAVAADDDGWGL